MKNRARILRFPGTWPGWFDVNDDWIDFESWEVWESLLQSGDYNGLVEYCKREVSSDPENLHAWEGLGEAYNLAGRHREALKAMGEVHLKFPDIQSFQHIILGALFALGKSENDYEWVEKPRVLRIGSVMLDECYEFLLTKRKPFDARDLSVELIVRGAYLTFSDEKLLAALSRDRRFVIEEGPYPGCERVRVRRKRDGAVRV